MPWFTNKGQFLQWGTAFIFGSVGTVIGLFGGAAVLTAMVGIAQKIMGLPVDWWILGVVFTGGVLLMWWTQAMLNKRLSSPESGVFPLPRKPSPVPPQDTENRKKIIVLFRAYGGPASGELKHIARNLLSQFRSFRVGDNWSEGHGIMAKLVDVGPYMVWSRADDQLRRVTDGQDEVDGVGLQHLLREFFLAYQNLVRWVILLDNFQVRFVAESVERKERVTRFRSVLEGKDFVSWQEKHKLFHQQFREVLAVDDFAKLRERVDGSWSDTFPPPMKV